jgi:hypothetical protein
MSAVDTGFISGKFCFDIDEGRAGQMTVCESARTCVEI